MTFWHSAGYIKNGLRTLWKRELTVDVLDATAITVSMLQGNFDTASSVMFMLRLGEILEEWTHKKSVADLAGAMSLQVDKVWIRDGEQEVLVPIGEVKAGNLMVVRMGNVIPLDGKVVSGEMTVNQASITGESLPVRKEAGSYVYAGTVAEEGQCVVCVEKTMGTGRYDKIINMIEESEKLKSETENKASDLADKLVPYTLGGTVLTYALTRNMTKALAVLMVDFSCALKLSMPIAVLSAMRESSLYHISVKGGKFMEAVAQADTIVFDKTGTLTYAAPKVADIITFGGKTKDDMLRLAACLEEHYPHSMANAVVNEAKARGLSHEEYHSKVEYVVAHGIQSTVEGQKVVIGSEHFVFEDEGLSLIHILFRRSILQIGLAEAVRVVKGAAHRHVGIHAAPAVIAQKSVHCPHFPDCPVKLHILRAKTKVTQHKLFKIILRHQSCFGKIEAAVRAKAERRSCSV